jgi:hypothetical protein
MYDEATDQYRKEERRVADAVIAPSSVNDLKRIHGTVLQKMGEQITIKLKRFLLKKACRSVSLFSHLFKFKWFVFNGSMETKCFS